MLYLVLQVLSADNNWILKRPIDFNESLVKIKKL